MTKICCISDTHGYLPEIPECDLFIHCGDICPVNNHQLKYQAEWLLNDFNKWLDNIPAKHKIITFGNHDFIGQEIPEIKYNLHCETLINELTEYDGLKIWGSPWTKKFYDWAFNATHKDLYKIHTSIPKCDIIVTHGPPYGFGDLGNRVLRDKNGNIIRRFQKHEGSPGLTRKILEIEPKLVVYGHFHSGRGTRNLGHTIICNTTYVNENYKPAYPPNIFEL